jgi:carboxylesterase
MSQPADTPTTAPSTSVLSESLFISGGPVGVLLAHSLGGSPAELRFTANALARAGYTVSCPLLAGHGNTRARLNETGWNAWYASLEEAHDRLRQSCEFIVVGGLSAGGVMTLRLAAQRPASVHAITLFSPTLWPDGAEIPSALHLFKIVIHKVVANLFRFPESDTFGIKDERMRKVVAQSLEQQAAIVGGPVTGFHGGTILEFRWMVQAVRSSLGTVQQPALIIHPREDDRSSLGNAAELQRRLGGLVETLVLNDSFHVCTLDKQRDVVAERTVTFVERVSRGVRQGAQRYRLRGE